MSGAALHVLLVEDNAGDTRLLREMFRGEAPGSMVLTHVDCMRDALVHLATGVVDIVLLDMGLPDGHGVETVKRALIAAPEVPVIVLTGLDDEAVAAAALEAGAQDYLIKGQIETRALPRALRYAIERHRMQAEADALRKQQLQLKNEFLSHVSHELRSPLSAIYQVISLLGHGRGGALSPEQQRYLLIAEKNCSQLKAMIDDLLEVTAAQTGKPRINLQVTSIPALIDDVVTSLQETAAAKNISLTAVVTHQVATAYADPTRVRQMLIILIDNALKFTPPHGVVTVDVQVHDNDRRFLRLEVSDSGCGINSDMTERIFERLFQAPDGDGANRRGLGLGLHICRELVTLQGGQIWARSEPGRGAVFSCTLPVFSVANLIAPAFKSTSDAEDTIALVVTEGVSARGALNGDAEAATNGVREVLGQCMHSDTDVLIPQTAPPGASDVWFIVARTDQGGAKAISKRIRDKFAESTHIQQGGVTYDVRHRLLRPPARGAEESAHDYVGRVAVGLQGLMDEERCSRHA